MERYGGDFSSHNNENNNPESTEKNERKGKLGVIKTMGQRLLMGAGLIAASSELYNTHKYNLAWEENYPGYSDQVDKFTEKQKKLDSIYGEGFSKRFYRLKDELNFASENAYFFGGRNARRSLIDHGKNIMKSKEKDVSETESETPEIQDVQTENEPLSSEEIKELIDNLPKGAVRGHAEKIGPIFNEEGDLLSVPNARVIDNKNSTTDVTFNSASKSKNSKELLGVLLHEFGHLKGVFRDQNLNPEEKADVWLKLWDRIDAKDRYDSPQVNGHIITKFLYKKTPTGYKVEIPQRYRSLLAGEYLADLFVQGYTDFTKLHVKDFAIIDSIIRKTHPEFNWKECNEKMSVFMEKLKAKSVKK